MVKKGKGIIWLATMWVLWNTWNDKVFNEVNVEVDTIVEEVKVLAWKWAMYKVCIPVCQYFEWCWDPKWCLRSPNLVCFAGCGAAGFAFGLGGLQLCALGCVAGFCSSWCASVFFCCCLRCCSRFWQAGSAFSWCFFCWQALLLCALVNSVFWRLFLFCGRLLSVS